jgi:hypothetical protein
MGQKSYDRLQLLAHSTAKVDWVAVAAALKERERELAS